MEKLLEKIGGMYESKKGSVNESELLNEAIPLSEYRRWYKKFKDMEGHKKLGDYRKRFDSWFPTTKDKDGKTLGSKWRHYIPVGVASNVSKKSKIAPKDIASSLETAGWKIEDYTTGMAVKTSSDSKDVSSEPWNDKKQYKVGSFVKVGDKTFKAIKNPTIGAEPSVGNREWLDFDKIAKGAPKKVEKSIGSIFVDLANKAKNEGRTQDEIKYKNLERKNQKFQKPPSETSKVELASEYVVISRHPYDVMGASTDRGWTSCQNIGIGHDDEHTSLARGRVKPWKSDMLYTGNSFVINGDSVYTNPREVKAGEKEPKDNSAWTKSDRYKVKTTKDKITGKNNSVAVRNFSMETPHEITKENPENKKMCIISSKGAYYLGIGGDVRFGAMVAYIIDADDKNINNPKQRMLIKPYINPNNGDVQLIASESQYGGGTTSRATTNNEFKRIVNDWLEENQSGEGSFRISQANRSEISNNNDFKKHKFHGHYPEEDSEIRVDSNYKKQPEGIEFKDDMTWEEILNQHRWFAKCKLEDVVVGEDYGTLILYSGKVSNGSWVEGDVHGGELSEMSIMKGNIKKAHIQSCNLVTVKLNECTINDSTFKIRNVLTNNCTVKDCESTGSIDAKDCTFKTMNFKEPDGDMKIDIKISKCKLQGKTTFSSKIKESDIKISDCEYVEYSQTGGGFSGILNGGSLKDVNIDKIITKGLSKLSNCVINHGIINDGIFKNCTFKAGIFKKGKWFGGNFEGGTFKGGHFILGTFGPDAIWKGGVWHDGEGKPANAKHDGESSSKKDITKKVKELDLRARLNAKYKG